MLPLRYILFCSIIITLSSCNRLIYQVPSGIVQLNETSDGYLAGTSKVDITPPPGQPQGGFGSDIGQVGRGWWDRLYVRSTFIQDQEGHFFIIANCDLWSFPKGLGDYVLRKLHNSNIPNLKIAREQIIFSATHTHHGPGNFATSIGYNIGSPAVAGFDKELFNFLGDKITSSIIAAYNNKRPVRISYSTIDVVGLSRNRSLNPFTHNKSDLINRFYNRISDTQSFVSSNPRCIADDSLQYKAINPTLTSITIIDQEHNYPISVLNNFGIHPTCMGAASPLYGGDIFNVANHIVRQYVRDQYQMDTDPVVTSLNGAEGDISPNWIKHGWAETQKIGQQLASQIIININSHQKFISGNVVTRLEFKSISGQHLIHHYPELKCGDGYQINRTAIDPLIGESLVYGTEDGRVQHKNIPIDECDYKINEGKPKSDCINAHGNKQIHLLGRAVVFTNPPDLAPVGIYSLGPLHFVALPGEITVALADQIIDGLNLLNSDHAMIVGLSNEYLSYFTTPEEYALQHYEGGSTLFGMASGPYLQESAQRVYKFKAYENNYYGKQKYKTWKKLKHKCILKDIKSQPYDHEDLLFSINLEDLIEGQDYIKYEWPISIRKLHDYRDKTSDNIIPNVGIEINKNNSWANLIVDIAINGQEFPIIQDDQNSNQFITYVKSNGENILTYESIYILPELLDRDLPIRFTYKSNDSEYKSNSFPTPQQ